MPNEKYAQKLVQIPWVEIWNPGTGFRSVDLKSSVFFSFEKWNSIIEPFQVVKIQSFCLSVILIYC